MVILALKLNIDKFNVELTYKFSPNQDVHLQRQCRGAGSEKRVLPRHQFGS